MCVERFRSCCTPAILTSCLWVRYRVRNAIETGCWAGPHGQRPTEIEGIGKNNPVQCMDLKVVDQVVCVCDRDAFMYVSCASSS
jgi:cysteine synthase